MSVRTVLAVVLAVALCGLSAPAIEDARTHNADRRVSGELASVANAMAELEREDAVPLGDPGARRVVTLDLPRASPTVASVEYVSLGGVPDDRTERPDGDVFAYRVEGGPPRARRVPFDFRVASYDGEWRVEPDGEPLVLRDPGSTRLAVVPVEYRGERTVLVVRAADL